MNTLRFILLRCLALPLSAASWKAGTAKADITPNTPIWMAGYGGRTKPSEGTLHPLWAKALALEDAKGWPDCGEAVVLLPVWQVFSKKGMMTEISWL